MALVVADRVQETTSTTSTSSYVLLGAATGYQSFGAVLANGDTTYYAITNDTDWEVGIGTYSTTGPTLARTTILASSNGGSAVSWGVGVKNIFISYAASKASFLDANGDLLVADKIVHTGDTNTAIRFPTADTVSIETGGTERFKIENSTITTTVPVLLPADPTLPLQAATKEYVDTIASAGIHYHDPVRVESPINLNATYNNGTSGVGATLTNAGTQIALVIDGVTVATNDRVLVYQQTDQTQNGVYVVTNTGSGSTNWVLTRSDDTDTYGPSDPDALGAGDAFFVQQGATGAGELYVCNTEGTITFGTTNITFTQIASTAVYTAGSGLALTGTVFSNTAQDQVVTLTQGGATTITGTYPNFTITSTDTTYTAGGGIGLTGTTFSVAAGSGLTQDTDGLSHADTSSQDSVDNSGAVFIQDVSLDGFGHVTSLASTTITPVLIGAATADSPVFTGVSSFPDGTAADPSITNTGDTNTGIFFPAADTIAFTEGGVESMRINASGDVGIGTSGPGHRLDVSAGQATVKIGSSTTSAGNEPAILMEHAGNNSFQIKGGANLIFSSDAGTNERMRITTSGDVGIGTSSPTADLSVGSTTTSSGDVHLRTTKTTFEVTPSNSDGGGADINVGFVAGGQGPLKFSIGGAERARIDSSGNLLVGGTSGSDRLYVENSLPTAYSASNTLTAPPLTWFYNTNATAGVAGTIRLDGGTSGGNAATTISAVHTGSGSSALTFGTRLSGSNVTERVRIDASGSVGIGTTTPGQLLDVNGTARVTSFGVGTAASGTTGEIRATNNITAYYSDDRLKTRIGVIDDPIGKVMSLSGFYYEANETAQALGYEVKKEVGVSAQEVQAVMPEVVAPAPIDEQYMTVRYERLVPLLIEAIKAQQVQIDELRAKLGV
jgi:hypothetical protein